MDVTGATPGAGYSLIDSKGKVADTRKAGSLGGIVFRNVEPGRGYRVRKGGKGGPQSPAVQGPQPPLGAAQHRASTTRRCPRAATAT